MIPKTIVFGILMSYFSYFVGIFIGYLMGRDYEKKYGGEKA